MYAPTDGDKADLGVARAIGWICAAVCLVIAYGIFGAGFPTETYVATLGALICFAGILGKRYFRSAADVVLGIMLTYGGALAGLVVAVCAGFSHFIMAG